MKKRFVLSVAIVLLLASGLLFIPKRTGSAVTIVQTCNNSTASAATTVACTLSSPVTANDLLVAVPWATNGGGTESFTIADANGSSWSTGSSATNQPNGGFATQVLYTCAAHAGSTDAVTATTTRGPNENFLRIVVMEVSGIVSSSCIDGTPPSVTNTNTANATPAVATTNSQTTTAARDLLIGAFGNTTGETYTPLTNGQGGTFTVQVSNSVLALETISVTSALSYSASIDFNGGGIVAYTGHFVAFKLSGPPPNQMPRVQ